MRHRHERVVIAGLVLVIALGLAGCPQVLMETAKKTMEDRTTGDQVTDTKIGTGLLASLADKDKNLLLDVNVDVWEQRAMITRNAIRPRSATAGWRWMPMYGAMVGILKMPSLTTQTDRWEPSHEPIVFSHCAG